ncbi:MAG: MBL fold metallo-hydrolase [Thermodesulfobacteriota bacterium]
MDILFLGVGEACDDRYANTSLLVKGAGGVTFLLDCGFSVPHLFFAECCDADALDAVWLSHFHGDHFFGMPLLLLRLWEMGRTRSLLILGPPGVKEKVVAAMELAYPNFLPRLAFPLTWLPFVPGREREIGGCCWSCAENDHSQPSLSLRITDGASTLFYSGDGRPTPASAKLATGCDLIVHEAFWVDEEAEGHGSVVGSINFAVQAAARRLALVHLNRKYRRFRRQAIDDLIAAAALPVFLPEPGDMVSL